MAQIVELDSFKRTAIERLEEVIKDIKNGQVEAMAVAYVGPNDTVTGNVWCCQKRPVTLIGELHCLMADIEFYEVDLRKHNENT